MRLMFAHPGLCRKVN